MTHRDIITTAFKWWLAAGCKTYGKSHAELAAMVGSYTELLSDVDEAALLDACKTCARTCTDFPSVADVLKAVEERREALRAAPVKPEDNDCEFCGGTGWEEIRLPDSETVKDCTFVHKCRCKVPGYVLPEPKPRKLLTAAERDEFREAWERR